MHAANAPLLLGSSRGIDELVQSKNLVAKLLCIVDIYRDALEIALMRLMSQLQPGPSRS